MAFAPTLLISIALIGLGTSASTSNAPASESNLAVLMEAMECDDFWVAVHATEYLIDLGYLEQAEKNCMEHLVSYEGVPQKRIGLWRVQYQLAPSVHTKARIVDKLTAAYLAPNGPDRIHAAETLAKLRFCFNELDQQVVQADMEAGDMIGAFVAWGMSIACPPLQKNDDHSRLLHLLQGDVAERKLAAYGLSFLSKPTALQWRALADKALAETDAETKAYLLGAAYQLYSAGQTADTVVYEQVRTQLLALVHSTIKSARMELCRALASRSDSDGKAVLTQLASLQSAIKSLPGHQNLDIRATAAYGLLKQYTNK